MIPKNLRFLSSLGLALCLLQAVPELSAIPVPPAPAPVVANAGSILARRVTGHVEAKDKPSQVSRQLANEARVGQLDVVSTADDGKSSVVLVFSTGTTVHLRHGSILDIEEFQQQPWAGKIDLSKLEAEPSSSHTRLNLVKGELMGKVTKLRKDGSSSMEVRTPVGVAGIRGTTFRIVFRPDPAHPGQYLFQLSTAEGSIEFRSNAPGSRPVMVDGNREITATVQVRIDPVTGVAVPVSAPVFQTGSQPISPQSLQQIQSLVVEVVQTLQGLILTTPSADRGPGRSKDQGNGQSQAQPGEQGQQGQASGQNQGQTSDQGQGPTQNQASSQGTPPSQDQTTGQNQTQPQDQAGSPSEQGQPVTPPADAPTIPSLPPQEPVQPPRVTSGEGR